MNNSVLDFAICVKTETLKILLTVERLIVKGNNFIFSFTAALLMFLVELMRIRDCTLCLFNIGARQRISYSNVCVSRTEIQVFLRN